MFKRLFDIIGSLVALLILWPVILIAALMILIKLGKPVFFVQERPGRYERIFKLIKFRSMLAASDNADVGNAQSEAQRLTCFGRMLRGSSIDELPELINVLRGEMSLVGPRPLLKQYLPLYSEQQRRRHEVRPGITGYAQVNGRNSLSWDERFELDNWYVENHTLWLDIKILLLTVLKVFRREGIAQEGHATMAPFTGKDD